MDNFAFILTLLSITGFLMPSSAAIPPGKLDLDQASKRRATSDSHRADVEAAIGAARVDCPMYAATAARSLEEGKDIWWYPTCIDPSVGWKFSDVATRAPETELHSCVGCHILAVRSVKPGMGVGTCVRTSNHHQILFEAWNHGTEERTVSVGDCLGEMRLIYQSCVAGGTVDWDSWRFVADPNHQECGDQNIYSIVPIPNAGAKVLAPRDPGLDWPLLPHCYSGGLWWGDAAGYDEVMRSINDTCASFGECKPPNEKNFRCVNTSNGNRIELELNNDDDNDTLCVAWLDCVRSLKWLYTDCTWGGKFHARGLFFRADPNSGPC